MYSFNASVLMHQSISPAPSLPPPPLLGYFGEFVNFALPGGWAFANPGAIPELLTRMQFPIRIQLYTWFYWKKSRLAHLSRTGIN